MLSTCHHLLHILSEALRCRPLPGPAGHVRIGGRSRSIAGGAEVFRPGALRAEIIFRNDGGSQRALIAVLLVFLAVKEEAVFQGYFLDQGEPDSVEEASALGKPELPFGPGPVPGEAFPRPSITSLTLFSSSRYLE